MTTTWIGAHVIVGVANVGEIPMTILVPAPEGENALERVAIFAQVIADHYASGKEVHYG